MSLVPDTTVPITVQIAKVRALAAERPHLVDHYDQLVSRLPIEQLEMLIRKHGSQIGQKGPLKYLDCPFWIYNKLSIAHHLRLMNSKSIHVLDIGMGGGHFSYVLKYLGHEATGIDVPNPLYEDICFALDVDRVTLPVDLNRSIDLEKRFDLVTAFAAQFFKLPGGNIWNTEDWKKFLADLISKSMNSPGRIYFTLNRIPESASHMVDFHDIASHFGGYFLEKGLRLDIPV